MLAAILGRARNDLFITIHFEIEHNQLVIVHDIVLYDVVEQAGLLLSSGKSAENKALDLFFLLCGVI